MLTKGHLVIMLLTGLFLSIFDYELALGQGQSQQQSLLTYKNPNLGGGIQYPSDWELQEESNGKLRFIKQEGFVTADLNVENLDGSETTLSEYASTRVNELQTQRPEFQLISSEPTTISNKPAQKVVYTFEREEDGKTNKVMRIWSIDQGKLYTLAYIAESGQYDQYLPTFQRMVDSFRLGDSDSGSSTTQVQSSQRSGDDDGSGNCDRVSYPDLDICIPPYPPDLNCPDIPYKNFQVTGADPHGFDRDRDGIGCEAADAGGVTPPDNGDGTPPDNGNGDCDPSYPNVCIKSPPPDLNCPDISDKNFQVIGSDPHGFDRDNDGIGCESATGVGGASSATPYPTSTPLTLTPIPPTDKKCPEDTHGTPPDCIPITDYCYLPGIGDWWDNPVCKDYLENKYKTIAPSPPSLSPPCPLDAEGNEICPPADELTPVPPIDGPTPVPEPSPECPDAGPEVCGEDTPPADEEPQDSDTDADDGNGNGDAGGDVNGEDGSNGDGNDGGSGDSNGGSGELFE